MSHKLKIVIAQQNFLVGDLDQNAHKIVQSAQQARDEFKADLIVFPELALTGYPPEDLLLRSDFQKKTFALLTHITQQITGITAIVGYPHINARGLFNAAAVIQNQKVIATYFKQHLPNYGVFDEKRYFTVDHSPCIFDCNGVIVGVTICEDLWYPDVIQQAKHAGAQVVCSLNASPYDYNKATLRAETIQSRAKETGLPIIYSANVGGQDELIFDGGSMAINGDGKISCQAKFFEEELLPVNIEINHSIATISPSPAPATLSTEASIYNALKLGLKDYAEKNKFSGVIVGLSGGIDSALTLTIAVDALGKDRVKAILLPSRFTSQLSRDVSMELINTLGIEYQEYSIESAYSAFVDTLSSMLTNKKSNVTTENIQARCRAIILMAISNETNTLLLTTGNKSEMAAGYATLYGDMAGGFAVLKDVYKTLAYRLADYRNSLGLVIPQAIIDRPPTAELAHDQKDIDSLPPYPVLDQILYQYVELDRSADQIIASGLDQATVLKVIKLVDRYEFKRRQAAPGIKITARAFGRDRRYPLTSGYEVTIG